MSKELDDPQALKRQTKRLLLSALAGFAAALVGGTSGIAVLVLANRLKLGWLISLGSHGGWVSFLWVQLCGLIFGIAGFWFMWKRRKD
jgi:hypothetical protein